MKTMNERILVIDDDENLLRSIKKILQMENYQVDTLVNAMESDQYLESQRYQCLLLDVKMPVIDGMEVLQHVIRKYPCLPVIMISGQSNIEIAIGAIKDGAYDFIEKPINPERLFIAVKNAIQRKNLLEINESFFKELQENFCLVGQSRALKNIIGQIGEVAATPAKVLIMGESGTGKGLVARAIHYNSQRKGKPFLTVNCASIPAELLESELFGHRRGSFTGAIADRKGKFIEADGGTLFLDEVGDMTLPLQAKLLRVLEENEIEVIGENFPRNIDVRIISATNHNLEEMTVSNRFREDLYYRLNVVKIFIPPLRERVEDILPLAYHFLQEFNNSYNKQILALKGTAESLLLNYQWPGNARQLRNTIENTVIFCRQREIGYEDVLAALESGPLRAEMAAGGNGGETTLKEVIHDFERKYILQTLQKHKWKISETAKYLGIDRSNLFKKMRKYELMH
jgi:DNA-binding NtrC family response regulator